MPDSNGAREIPKGEVGQRGTWRLLEMPAVKLAVVTCRNCAEPIVMGSDTLRQPNYHHIECPMKCGYAEAVHLLERDQQPA